MKFWQRAKVVLFQMSLGGLVYHIALWVTKPGVKLFGLF